MERLGDPSIGGVMVVAHRGCWQEAPENSLLAIRRCIDNGVDLIELDVRATRDGALVLLHDETLDRTTDLQGKLSKLDYADIETARLRQRAGGQESPFTDESIPTLEEALLLARDEILINLDVKEDIYGQVLGIVQETGAARQILMKKRSLGATAGLLQLPFMGLTLFMPILGECDDRAKREDLVCAANLAAEVNAFQDLAPVAYEIVFTDLAYFVSGINAVSDQNARLWVNTMAPRYAAGFHDLAALDDPDAHWGTLISLGANMIQTDHPEQLLHFLRARNLRGTP